MNPHFPDDAYAVVDGWSAVEADGPDAGKFLQNFCTNDLLALRDRNACEAMFPDAKAHVVAYGWVVRWSEDRFVVLLGSDRAAELAAHLDRYLIRERVELRARTLEATTIGRFAEGVPLAALGPGVVAVLDACPSVGGASRLSPGDFERLRIRRGTPLDGVDVDARNLPQEVDRSDRAISFTKGCYLGQEPVARIDALGRVNWLLRGLAIAGPTPPRDTELTIDGKPVGRVTSSVAAAEGALALAYVRREHSADGVVLRCGESMATVRTFS